MNKVCGTCKWWMEVQDDRAWRGCFRYPKVEDKSRSMTCGEWAGKEEDKVTEPFDFLYLQKLTKENIKLRKLKDVVRGVQNDGWAWNEVFRALRECEEE